MSRTFTTVAAMTASMLASGTVSAHFIFLPDFSPAAIVETFESLSPGVQRNPLELSGVSYSDPAFLGVDNHFSDFANFQPPGSSLRTLYASGNSALPFTIQFPTSVDRAGLLLSSDGQLSWILVALDASFNVLENGFISQPGPSQAVFAGFEDFAGISQLRVQVVGPNPSGYFPHFDDVRYERLVAVAEPGAELPLGIALIALGIAAFYRLRTHSSDKK